MNLAAGEIVNGAENVMAHPADRRPALGLSAREVEVIRLVADGWSNKQIASQLSLSALTVKNHLARIGRKLGAGNRAHIVAIACRGGLIAGVSASPDFLRRSAT
jgi:DNA-binding NarL/FixJ family response regulator